MADYQLFIDGEWSEAASGETYTTYNPANGEKIAEVSKGGRADAIRAIEAARKAFDEGPWPKMTGAERGAVLREIASGITAKQQELAQLESMDSGGTIRKAMLADVAGCAGTFLKFAEYAETVAEVEELPPVVMGPQPSPNYLRWEPIGVCGQITPWNFPLVMAAWKMAPALAAGNTVVLKPASITSLTALELARVCSDVGLPRGVLNVVSGPGSTVGEEIASNRLVDKVAFTGSTEVGARVMQLAAPTVKKVTLELGGKSPAIVMDDVNLDLAAKGVLFGTFMHNGQVCESGTRAIVLESVHDELLAKMKELAMGIKLGDPAEFSTDQGPLVSAAQLDTVERYVEIGKGEGATLVCGGKRPKGDEFANGYFYEPTIFCDVDNNMKIAQEEIFGPVLSVIKVKDEEEAIRVANDSIYGLAGAVWCADTERAKGIADRLRTGTVWINEHHILGPDHPFGGYKQSGVGSELGVWGYNEYRLKKRVHVDGLGQDPSAHLAFAMLFSS